MCSFFKVQEKFSCHGRSVLVKLCVLSFEILFFRLFFDEHYRHIYVQFIKKWLSECYLKRMCFWNVLNVCVFKEIDCRRGIEYR